MTKRSKSSHVVEGLVAVSMSKKPAFPAVKGRLLAIILVALLVVVALVVVITGHHKTSTTDQTNLSTSALNQQVNSLNSAGNYDAARTLIAKQESYHTLDDQVLYATTYINAGDHSGALQVLLAADKHYSITYPVATLIAEQEEAVGNRQQAIAYYQKSITLFNKEAKGPTSDDAVVSAQAAIQRLQ